MTRNIVVASVPSRHVYTRHIGVPLDGVRRIASSPDHLYEAANVLDPSWISGNAHRIDVFHVHFGFRAVPYDQLAASLEMIGRHNLPLIYTAHDLHDPQSTDAVLHTKKIGLLMERADRLVTLTSAASCEIQAQFGQAAQVVPHPHVVPLHLVGRERPNDERAMVVGIHLKSLRPGLDPITATSSVLDAAERGAPWTVRVDLNTDATHLVDANLGSLRVDVG